MSAPYVIFENYENGQQIKEHEISKLIDYLAGQLISWSPNRSYYQAWYNESNNLQIVIRWRKKKYGLGFGKCGERVCYENAQGGKIVDLFKDKNHIKNNNCTCNCLDV